MIFNVGYLILIAALLISIFGIVTGYLGGKQRNPRLIQSSYNSVLAVAGLVGVAAVILWYGLLTDKFQVVYIWNHSERSLPTSYKFSAIWGGQQGSLLFWALVLSVFSVVAVLTFRRKHAALMPYVYATLLSSKLFFLVLLVFAANPFRMVAFVPEDGQGLNPLLQNYWMVIHPVMLYFGYVGLAVPFAFAIGALISKRLDTEWVRTIRRWTLIPWMFLSAGIIMGSQWAYMELGWGGYWAWDPVENASFLPWLTATAFLHSIIIQEQRGILKVWNVILIASTYFLVILGTFTTRSGVLESVHSFARSDVGPYFLVYMTLLFVGFLYLLFTRMPLLHGEHQIDGVVSRESAFLANNWLFAGITFAVLWGTFFPMFSEILTGDRISVAAPWFNKVVGPLFLALVLLMGVGPLLGWRFTNVKALRRQFTWPAVVGIIIGGVTVFFTDNVYPIVGMAICAFVTAAIVQEYVRGILARRKHNEESVPVAMGQLMRRNGRRYGGYIVHLGIVFIGVAVLGNEFFQQTTNITLARGESVEIAGYSLVYMGLESEREGNHVSISTPLAVFDADTDRQLAVIHPKRNIYDKNPEMPTSEVGLRMTPVEDVYAVINGWDNGGDTATFTFYVNPLTMWMWVGGIVIVLGVLLAIWPTPAQRTQTISQSAYVPVGAGD
ncbi:MAG: heme lyase CcmF/NrfE family subunit [Caldilineaceae bacterium]|nr:heme lyase CcmF/NrfE family subunit [Caldilineaceae bacterium]